VSDILRDGRDFTSRYKSVPFNEESRAAHDQFTLAFERLDLMVEDNLVSPRAKALARTKLEEAHGWIGKAIRDDQVMNKQGPIDP
jgi:hypothetical protein